MQWYTLDVSSLFHFCEHSWETGEEFSNHLRTGTKIRTRSQITVRNAFLISPIKSAIPYNFCTACGLYFHPNAFMITYSYSFILQAELHPASNPFSSFWMINGNLESSHRKGTRLSHRAISALHSERGISGWTCPPGQHPSLWTQATTCLTGSWTVRPWTM